MYFLLLLPDVFEILGLFLEDFCPVMVLLKLLPFPDCLYVLLPVLGVDSEPVDHVMLGDKFLLLDLLVMQL